VWNMGEGRDGNSVHGVSQDLWFTCVIKHRRRRAARSSTHTTTTQETEERAKDVFRFGRHVWALS
jgi:hypothetical protein